MSKMSCSLYYLVDMFRNEFNWSFIVDPLQAEINKATTDINHRACLSDLPPPALTPVQQQPQEQPLKLR